MADLNDPVDPAKAKDAAEEPANEKAVDGAETDESAAPVTEPVAEKPVAETVAAAKPAEPVAKPAEPVEVKPKESASESKPVAPPTKAVEAEPAPDKPAAAEPVAEAKPDLEAKPAVEAKAAAKAGAAPTSEPGAHAEAEKESGTMLPDSIVSGAVASTPVASDSDEKATDTEHDGEDYAAAPSAAGPARNPRRKVSRPRPLVAALSLLLVVLLAAGVTLFVHYQKVSAAEASKMAALNTARTVATSLTTITPDNAVGQIDALAKQSTGSFKDQITGYSAMFQAVLKQGNVASRGTITAAGIEKMEGDAASALVTVSALITSGQVPQGQPRVYRLLVSLQRSGDQWLASNVDFVQ